MARFTNLGSFVTGRTTVTVSGTPVQFAANVVPPGIKVIVRAPIANTGVIHIGSSSANALNTAGTSFRLSAATQPMELMVDNTDRIWADSTVSGETVDFYFEQ